MKRILLISLICIFTINAGLFDGIKKIGNSIAKETNNYVIKPVGTAEKFMEKEVVSAAKAVGSGVSTGAKAIAHETVAMYDHITNL